MAKKTTKKTTAAGRVVAGKKAKAAKKARGKTRPPTPKVLNGGLTADEVKVLLGCMDKNAWNLVSNLVNGPSTSINAPGARVLVECQDFTHALLNHAKFKSAT